MATKRESSGATARMVNNDCRSTVEVSLPVGTRFEDVVAKPDLLVDIFTKFRPRGCEACLSGRDFLIRERFDDVINVELGG
jgi:hypothetical protein